MTSTPETDAEFEALLEFIRESRAFDFTGYKRPSLTRRITKRLQERRVNSFAEYQELLRNEPDEFAALFDTILINVTSFFRDEPAWDYIRDQIVPRILEANKGNIRVWSTGCATGEEAYTVAILFAEALGDDEFTRRVKIYATDIDNDALTSGRHARYTAKDLVPVPPELRERYFEATNSSFVFRQDLRRNVIFGRHDLIQDPPISRIDLLISRNTLMYFLTDAQERILRNFHFALRDGGYLFLGKAEAMVARSPLFTAVDLKRRIFGKVSSRPIRAVLPPDRTDRTAGIDREADAAVLDAALDAAPVAQVVIDHDGTVIHANAHARLLFDLNHADVGRPIQDLPLSYRPVELRSRIEEVQEGGHAIWIRGVELQRPDATHVLDLQVSPLLAAPGNVVGVTVNATDVTRYTKLRDEVNAAKRELETAYEELQSTNEELETTNEELQSTNEELETTNEELQSTNEELETMNEELQSSNEELETTNDELHQRTDEMNQATAFVESVLESMRAAVVVVDRDLGVRGWNEGAHDLWGLRADEVLGRHLLTLDIGVPVPELRAPIGRILAGEEKVEVTVKALTRRGREVECHVDLTPLQNHGRDGVEGAILLMRAEQPAER
ncbi:MAG TPA: CheR family methyltransferase [Gaiellaceae bacterium]